MLPNLHPVQDSKMSLFSTFKVSRKERLMDMLFVISITGKGAKRPKVWSFTILISRSACTQLTKLQLTIDLEREHAMDWQYLKEALFRNI